MDICVAAAGIPSKQTPCPEYEAEKHRKIKDVNTNGGLFTTGDWGARFKNPGSIVLVASMSGPITDKD